MITLEQLTPIGTVNKTHGIKGEMNITLDVPIDLDITDHIILDIDQIFTPFFITQYRYRSNTTVLVMLDDIDTEAEARHFYNKTVYIEKQLIEKNDEMELTPHHLVGYTLINGDTAVGQITEVDLSTANALFSIGDTLIPIGALEIVDVDHKDKIIKGNLPEGLLSINN